MSNKSLFIDRAINPEKNVSVGDMARVRNDDKTVAGVTLTGFVAEIKDGKLRIHHGGWYPLDNVLVFMERHGDPIPTGTASLPVNGY